MPSHRQFVGRTTVGLLFIVMAAACSMFGPDLNIDIENEGRKVVTVTVDSSGLGKKSGGEDVSVPPGQGVAWSEPLGSTWEVKVDGNHVIGSGDQTVLALPAPGQGQDVTVSIRFDADGSMTVQATR